MSWLNYADAPRQDARYAMRLLRRAPAFAVLATLTLGLGIGASTTLFTVLDGVVLRPLPFPAPQELATLRFSSGSRFPPRYIDQWRRQARTIADIASWYGTQAVVSDHRDAFQVRVDRATPNFFHLLRATPLLGRTFTTNSDPSHIASEVVLSYDLWTHRYGADPGAIGRRMVLDGEPFTIVGVMPRAFNVASNELANSRTDVWTPFRLAPQDENAGSGFLNVIIRLAPAATIENAERDLSAIAGQIEKEHPSYAGQWRISVVQLLDATVKNVRLTLFVVFGTATLLLLVASGGVAHLSLARLSARQTEFAIRRSLGATTSRLARQSLIEALVISALGGLAGIGLWSVGIKVLLASVPAGLDLPRLSEVTLALPTLLFVVGTLALVTILFAVLPAQVWSRAVVVRGSATVRRTGLARFVIAAEAALVIVALTGAGLFSRTLWALARVDIGFRAQHVLTLRLTVPEVTYGTDARIREISRTLIRSVEDLSGVQAAGIASYLPLSNIGAAGTFVIEGEPTPRVVDRHSAWVCVVGGHYFDTMGIPLLAGRLPAATDTEATHPIFVIDEGLWRHEWPKTSPIGKWLIWSGDKGEPIRGEIVGVVGSVHWASASAEPPATVYWWSVQAPTRDMTLVVRAAGVSNAVARQVAGAVKEIDPNQPIGDIHELQDSVTADLARPQFVAWLVVGFAALALLLAMIGLYGVVSLWTMQRTREIGIRVALGAQRHNVVQTVMSSGMRAVALGTAIGAGVALVAGQLVASLLFGVEPTDPPSLVAATVLLISLAAVATYVPARRAARLDPLVAMREE
jgi:predicted permease